MIARARKTVEPDKKIGAVMVFDQRHAATQLTVEVRDRTPDVVTVGISGELDRETCATAERVITELLRTERPRCVALDMSEVTFMGADG